MNVIKFCLCLFLCAKDIASKPNVLFIISDDLRPAIGCYGDRNAHTPNIDQLAQKSFIYKNAYAQVSVTSNSLYKQRQLAHKFQIKNVYSLLLYSLGR